MIIFRCWLWCRDIFSSMLISVSSFYACFHVVWLALSPFRWCQFSFVFIDIFRWCFLRWCSPVYAFRRFFAFIFRYYYWCFSLFSSFSSAIDFAHFAFFFFIFFSSFSSFAFDFAFRHYLSRFSLIDFSLFLFSSLSLTPWCRCWLFSLFRFILMLIFRWCRLLMIDARLFSSPMLPWHAMLSFISLFSLLRSFISIFADAPPFFFHWFSLMLRFIFDILLLPDFSLSDDCFSLPPMLIDAIFLHCRRWLISFLMPSPRYAAYATRWCFIISRFLLIDCWWQTADLLSFHFAAIRYSLFVLMLSPDAYITCRVIFSATMFWCLSPCRCRDSSFLRHALRRHDAAIAVSSRGAVDAPCCHWLML